MSIKINVRPIGTIKSKINIQNVTTFVAGDPTSGIRYRNYNDLRLNYSESFRIGDEGWRFQRGDFTNFEVSNPRSVAALETVNGIPQRLFLKQNNIFGNKNRYTDPLGGQDYLNPLFETTFSGDFSINPYYYYIDHLYGMAIAAWNDINGLTGYRTTFDEAVTMSNQFSLDILGQTVTGFGIMTIGELQEMGVRQEINTNDQMFNRPPFNIDLANTIVATCTPQLGAETVRVLSVRGNNRQHVLSLARYTDNRHYFFAKNIQSVLQ